MLSGLPPTMLKARRGWHLKRGAMEYCNSERALVRDYTSTFGMHNSFQFQFVTMIASNQFTSHVINDQLKSRILGHLTMQMLILQPWCGSLVLLTIISVISYKHDSRDLLLCFLHACWTGASSAVVGSTTCFWPAVLSE